mmetsp:Transcript_29954/g.96639  ORF Transcript_29954/g.96639 Transcript_29954/m.96639 type:complete len:328 (-) Transcript_29954:75-1058(-)
MAKMMTTRFWCSLLLLLVRLSSSSSEGPPRVRQAETSLEARRWPVECRHVDEGSACPRHGDDSCDRILYDDFIPEATVNALLSIAGRGMARSPASFGGPTIFDANSGYLMSPGARLENVYATNDARPEFFDSTELGLYKSVIQKLKAQVEASFGGVAVHFTAPTFIARLSGENASWAPAEPHDEYWHAHADKDNTAHYEYSGLLYLSDFGKDFQGGLFEFVDDQGASLLQVEPRRGRLLLFASTRDNRHKVNRVTEGLRFALSFWFTCDPQFEFNDFLDGNMHLRFREEPGKIRGGQGATPTSSSRRREKEKEEPAVVTGTPQESEL